MAAAAVPVPQGPLVVGVDSSTQSTKALVVDSATGAVVAGDRPRTPSATVTAPVRSPSPSSGGRR